MNTYNNPPIRVGDLVECCNLMPGIVMSIDEAQDDVRVRMLDVDEQNGLRSFSLRHCGLFKLTVSQVRDRLILGKEELTRLWSGGKPGEDYSMYEVLIQQKALSLKS